MISKLSNNMSLSKTYTHFICRECNHLLDTKMEHYCLLCKNCFNKSKCIETSYIETFIDDQRTIKKKTSKPKKAAKFIFDVTTTIAALPIIVAVVVISKAVNKWNEETRRVCGTR